MPETHFKKPPLRVLQASAGSGKTYSLTQQYISLLFLPGASFKEILALTFTNDATREMRERILGTLKRLALQDANAVGVVDYLLRLYPAETVETIAAKAGKFYRSILHDYRSFAVTTIDAFTQNVVRNFTFELDIDSGYEVELNTGKVITDLQEMLNHQLSTNQVLLQWVTRLVIAQLADGKRWNYTGTLRSVAAELFNEKFETVTKTVATLPTEEVENLLAVLSETASNTVKEFEQGILPLLKRVKAASADIGNYAENISRYNTHPLKKLQEPGGDNNLELAKKIYALKEPVTWINKKTPHPPEYFNAIWDEIRSLQAFYDAHYSDYQIATQLKYSFHYLRLTLEMQQLLKTYREDKSMLLIADVQRLLKEMLAAGAGNPAFIYEKTGSRFKYFLFDEFQDTSVTQYGNLKPLLENALATTTGAYHEHLVVGDIKQAIYRWRNGNWTLMHSQLGTDIGNHYIAHETLANNYRSRANIISANNHLFKAAAQLLQTTLNDTVGNSTAAVLQWWRKQGYDEIITRVYSQVEQQPHGGTLPGGEFIIEVSDGALTATDDDGETDTGDLNTIVAAVTNLHETKGVPYERMAVLVRTNNEAQQVLNDLLDSGIPAASAGTLLLQSGVSARLIMAVITALAIPDTQNSIAKATAVSLWHMLQQKDVPATVLPGLAGKPLSGYAGLLPEAITSHTEELLKMPLAELIDRLIGAFGLDQAGAAGHLAYLYTLKSAAVAYTQQGEKGLYDFVNWYNTEGLNTEVVTGEASAGINISTIHKSKGLAYDYVFLVAKWSLSTSWRSTVWFAADDTQYAPLGHIPLNFKKDLASTALAPGYMEELMYSYMDSLNALYVAATRAVHYLHIILPKLPKDVSKPPTSIQRVIIDIYAAGNKLGTGISNILFHEGFTDSLPAPAPDIGSGAAKTYLRTPKMYGDMFEPAEFTDLPGPKFVRAQNEGTVLHRMLEEYESDESLHHSLQAMVREGMIENERVDNFITRAKILLASEAMLGVINMPGQVMREQTLIAEDGSAYRPDRLVVHGNTATVVDYKFTLKTQQKHIAQVERYKDILRHMGYENVKGYLFYAFDKQLVEV